jgi:hypothetical protein
MTLLGIGEKALPNISTLALVKAAILAAMLFLRDSVVSGHVVVGLVGLTLSRSLLGNHLSIAVSGCRRLPGRRRRTTFLATSSHAGVVSDGLAADEGGGAHG